MTIVINSVMELSSKYYQKGIRTTKNIDMAQKTHISEREVEVLDLIAHEYTTKEIAELLYISTHTAHSHRKSLLYKMGVRNTAGLVRRAFEMNLLIPNHNILIK